MRYAKRTDGTDAGRLRRGIVRRLRDGAVGLVESFARGEGGNVAIITAIAAVPIAIMMAVAIDTAELYRAKSNFQQSADAAVLVAAKVYSDGGGQDAAREAGEKAFADNLANLADSSGMPIFAFPPDCSEGNITVTVAGDHPLFFPGVHGVDTGENSADAINVRAGASCPTTSFEVALVVDTSGSMGWAPSGGGKAKIATLKTAAKGLVEDLFAVAPTIPRKDPVKFAVVPFSGMVAIDYENKLNPAGDMRWNQAFEDRQGRSPIHHKDFDWTWDTKRNPEKQGARWWSKTDKEWLTRYTLFDDLNVKWKGCMQARPYPHNSADTPPSTAQPASLFVPAFAPDEPENRNREEDWRDRAKPRPHCVRWQNKKNKSSQKCRKWSDGKNGTNNKKANPRKPTWDQRPYYVRGEYQIVEIEKTGNRIEDEMNFTNDYIVDGTNMPKDNICRGEPNHQDCTGNRDQPLRQGWTFKYKNAQWHSGLGSNDGPNSNCRSAALLPLSTNEKSIKSYIDTLKANGSTNVPAGAAWGWRTLSSNLPYAGRSEKRLDNRKIMILMTDGQNTYYSPRNFARTWEQYWAYSDFNRTTYGGYGYGRHATANKTDGDGYMYDGFNKYASPGHNFTTRTEAMDDMLLRTCENAKKANVTVYTIAFDVPNGSSIKKALLDCASPTQSTAFGTVDGDGRIKLYTDASNSQELTNAFKAIAESLQKLKLVE